MNSSVLIFLIGTVLCSITLIVASIINRSRREQKQKIGLEWLHVFRSLLANVQKHRGLTNGYLNGEKKLSVDIKLLQSKVTDDIHSVARVDQWIEENSRWQGITQHWARLSSHYEKNPADNNLQQHNQLIQNILYLIDEIAQEHDLLLLKTIDGKPLHFAWRELLTAAECVGQARAVGTGIIASGHCDSVSRIRINYLSQKIKRTTQATWSIMSPSASQTSSINRLLEVINSAVTKESPDISTNEYFSIATEALDGLHEQYDNIIDHLG